MKKESEKNLREEGVLDTYGGFRYRFSYDDYKQQIEEKLIRQRRRGIRAFVMTSFMVSFLCCFTLIFAMIYRTCAKGSSYVFAGPVEGIQSPSLIPEDKPLYSVDFRDFGSFVIENLDAEAASVYHIPQGVVVTYVAMLPSYSQNSDKLMLGDIIISVNGIETPSVLSFQELSNAEEDAQWNFVIYREGKYVDISYVLD